MNIGDVPEITCKIENFILIRINGERKKGQRKEKCYRQFENFQYQINMYFNTVEHLLVTIELFISKKYNDWHEIKKITYLSVQNSENFQIPSLFIKRLNLYVQKACYFYVLLNKQVFASLLWNLAASTYNFVEISQGLKPVSYRWVQFSLL